MRLNLCAYLKYIMPHISIGIENMRHRREVRSVKKDYIGSIQNSGAQKVEAPFAKGKKGKSSVIRRSGTGGSGK